MCKKIQLNTNELDELNTRQYGSEFCIVCEKDITKGNKNAKRDYPEEIANLFETQFKDKGPRFGSVYPRIDSGNNRKKVGKAATISDAVRTSYDPVVFDVEDEKLANEIENLLINYHIWVE